MTGHPTPPEDRQRSDRVAALLWEPERVGKRGPRPALSVAQIVGAGVEVADANGLTALSMRAVAERLGTSTTGLYRYVPGRDELVTLMVDQVAAEAAPPPDASVGWREQLAHIAHQEWALYHRHPWLLEVPLGRTIPGPNSTAKYDAGLAAVLAIGLSVEEAVSVFNAIDHLVLGAARASTENLAFLRRSGVPAIEWWRQHGGAAILPRLQAGQFPALAQVIDGGGFPEDGPVDATDGSTVEFEAALALLLDGIAARVEARADTHR